LVYYDKAVHVGLAILHWNWCAECGRYCSEARTI